MVVKKDKYLIEDIKRMNSRFFLIQLHHKYYIIDYYNFKSYRWFYPLSAFYNNKSLHTWDIYGIKDEDLVLFKLSPITFGNTLPNSLGLMAGIILYPLFTWFFFFRLPIIVAIFLSLLVLAFLIYLGYIEMIASKGISNYIRRKNVYVQKIKSLEKPRHRSIKIFSNGIAIIVLVFWLWLFIEIAVSSYMNWTLRLYTLIFYLVLTLGISTMLGRIISGISYVPNVKLKYQIIEKMKN